ncbi:hypothetical protein F5051DRAFT_434439 [Lentinula edodes]|nr:hypothetical protein F5051DRAFT_434439 [Lentinula edodes]
MATNLTTRDGHEFSYQPVAANPTRRNGRRFSYKPTGANPAMSQQARVQRACWRCDRRQSNASPRVCQQWPISLGGRLDSLAYALLEHRSCMNSNAMVKECEVVAKEGGVVVKEAVKGDECKEFSFALEGVVQLNGFRDAEPSERLQQSAVRRTLPEALKSRRTSGIKLFIGTGSMVPGSEPRLVWDFVAIKTEIKFDSFSLKLTGAVARTMALKTAAVALFATFVGIAWTAPNCKVEKADVGEEVAEENGRWTDGLVKRLRERRHMQW